MTGQPRQTSGLIVLGCGRVGAEIAVESARGGIAVAIIDRDPASFDRLPPEFDGRTVHGDGMDRTVLEEAGVADCRALAALMYGDNTNIVTARIAKETYGVPSVVARIKDPRRAEIYQRLGIPTVAPVPWAVDQILRRIQPTTSVDWTHSSGSVRLIERTIPAGWIGRPLDGLTSTSEGFRLAVITRSGRAQFPSPNLIGQEGDLLHIVVQNEATDALDATLSGGSTP